MNRSLIAYIRPEENDASAFGLNKVAQEWTQLHLSFAYNLNPDLVLTDEVNGGTVTHADNFAVCQTGTNPAGQAELLSRDAVKYVPGQGIVARQTAIFTAGVADSQQVTGVGDITDTDALGFGFYGTTFGAFHRNNGLTTFIPQASWVGSGNVPRIFDPLKLNVYMLSFQWLGGGALRWYIEDPLTGRMHLVHMSRYADTAVVTSLRNPTMGFFMHVSNSGNTSNLTLKVPSFGMVTEAPENSYGLPGTFSAQKTGVGATEVPLFSIRNMTTYGGVVNKVRAHLRSMTFATTKDCQLRLVKNATLTGGAGAWTAFKTDASVIETNTDRTGITASTGRRLITLVGETLNGYPFDLCDDAVHLNPTDVVTLTAQSTAGTAIVTASLNWREEF